MAYATSDIILWAKITQGLASLNEPKKKARIGGSVDIDLDNILRVERMSLEWQLQQDPTDVDGFLFPMGNYVLSLIGDYLPEAQQTSGGSGVVVNPVNPSVTNIYPFPITSADFATSDTYNDTRILGDELTLFINEYAQQWIYAPADFVYTATGIQIVIPGFDANLYSYHILVQKLGS